MKTACNLSIAGCGSVVIVNFVPKFFKLGYNRGNWRKGVAELSYDRTFFSNRVVNLWNNLPEEVVMAPSVSALKLDLIDTTQTIDTVWFGKRKDMST